MHRFLFFLFPLSAFSAIAQPPEYAKILNNPDVIWAAEIEQSFMIAPENNMEQTWVTERYNNKSTLLKQITTSNSKPEYQVQFGYKILDLCKDRSIPVYDESDFERPISDSLRTERIRYAGGSADSITVIDPVTFLEKNVRVSNNIDPNSVQLIKLKQLLFFSKKTDEFDVYTYAWSPYIQVSQFVGGERYVRYLAPLFWFKMQPYSKKKQRKVPKLKSKDITWARRIETGRELIHLDSLMTFKDFEQPIMQRFLNRVRTDKNYVVKEGLDWTNIDFLERICMMEYTDTTITFDPETYEEITLIQPYKMQGEEIMQLKIQQDFFWNERKKNLEVRLFAFAPVEKKKDEQGNFRFYQPLFWRQVR